MLAKKRYSRELIVHRILFFYELSLAEVNYGMSDPAEKTEFHKFIARKLCEFKEPIERSNHHEAVAARYAINVEALQELIYHIISETEN